MRNGKARARPHGARPEQPTGGGLAERALAAALAGTLLFMGVPAAQAAVPEEEGDAVSLLEAAGDDGLPSAEEPDGAGSAGDGAGDTAGDGDVTSPDAGDTGDGATDPDGDSAEGDTDGSSDGDGDGDDAEKVGTEDPSGPAIADPADDDPLPEVGSEDEAAAGIMALDGEVEAQPVDYSKLTTAEMTALEKQKAAEHGGVVQPEEGDLAHGTAKDGTVYSCSYAVRRDGTLVIGVCQEGDQEALVGSYINNGNSRIPANTVTRVVNACERVRLTRGTPYAMNHGLLINQANLTDISALADWDVSTSVYSFQDMFLNCSSLVDISPLKNWDVHSVSDFYGMFEGCTSLNSVEALRGWDTAALTRLARMFLGCTSLVDISALSNWNTSKVTNAITMFSDCTSLEDISAIADWNLSNSEYYADIFAGCENIRRIGLSAENAQWLASLPDAVKERTFALEEASGGADGQLTLASAARALQPGQVTTAKGAELVDRAASLTEPEVWSTSYFVRFEPGVDDAEGAMPLVREYMPADNVEQYVTLPECAFTRDGYKFIGWSADPDESQDPNALLQPGDTASLGTPDLGSLYSLYANWEKLPDPPAPDQPEGPGGDGGGDDGDGDQSGAGQPEGPGGEGEGNQPGTGEGEGSQPGAGEGEGDQPVAGQPEGPDGVGGENQPEGDGAQPGTGDPAGNPGEDGDGSGSPGATDPGASNDGAGDEPGAPEGADEGDDSSKAEAAGAAGSEKGDASKDAKSDADTDGKTPLSQTGDAAWPLAAGSLTLAAFAALAAALSRRRSITQARHTR